MSRTAPGGAGSQRRCGLERCAALRRPRKARLPAASAPLFIPAFTLAWTPAHLPCHHEGPVRAGPPAAGRRREVSAAAARPASQRLRHPRAPIARFGRFFHTYLDLRTARNGAVRDGRRRLTCLLPSACLCGRPPRLSELWVLFGVSRGGRGIVVAALMGAWRRRPSPAVAPAPF